jgi:hypothetical protein
MRKLGGYTVQQRAAHYIKNYNKNMMMIAFSMQINKTKTRKNGSKHTLDHLIAARNMCYNHFGIVIPAEEAEQDEQK